MNLMALPFLHLMTMFLWLGSFLDDLQMDRGMLGGVLSVGHLLELLTTVVAIRSDNGHCHPAGPTPPAGETVHCGAGSSWRNSVLLGTDTSAVLSLWLLCKVCSCTLSRDTEECQLRTQGSRPTLPGFESVLSQSSSLTVGKTLKSPSAE